MAFEQSGHSPVVHKSGTMVRQHDDIAVKTLVEIEPKAKS